jgi:hypothetical protein
MGVMLNIRQVAVILAVLVLALLAWGYLAQPAQVKTPQDVSSFVLQDAQSSFTGQDVAFAVNSISYDNSSGQWEATVKITVNPHSQCPTVYERYYYLLPLRHDLDKLVTGNCQTSSVVAIEEEAIVDSRSYPQVAPLLDSSPYACGFHLPLNTSLLGSYCPQADPVAVENFASQLPENASWMVYWSAANSTALVGMDLFGNQVYPQN